MPSTNFFPLNLPIVCVSMRGVSDVNFAMISAKSNVISSVATNNYVDDLTDKININVLENELAIFKNNYKDKNLIITIQEHRLTEDGIIDLITTYGTHCEILRRNIDTKTRNENFAKLKNKNIKLIAKSVDFNIDLSVYDGVIFKGQKAAGRINENSSDNLEEIVKKFVDLYPNKAIIPCGGISNKSQIEHLLNLGATAVGIGTLFAFSEESKISNETKNQIIKLKKENIVKLNSDNLKQNAIVFSEWKGKDDGNNSQSLKAGILNPGSGHIFVGEAIDNINSIKSFQSIVNDII